MKYPSQDMREVIMILSKQVLADAELKNTAPKWRAVKEIDQDGMYLYMANGDLIGNSTFTYIKNIDNTWVYNYEKVQVTHTKLNCKSNKKSLFFGPIPIPESSKKKR